MKKKHLCLLLCMFMLAYCIYAVPIRVEHRDPDDQTHLIFSDEDGNIIKEIAVESYVKLSSTQNYALELRFRNPLYPKYRYGGWWDKPLPDSLQAKLDSIRYQPQLEPDLREITEWYKKKYPSEDFKGFVVDEIAQTPPKNSSHELPTEDPQARPAWEEWKHQTTTVIATVYDSTGNMISQWDAPRLNQSINSFMITNKGIIAIAGKRYHISALDFPSAYVDVVRPSYWLLFFDPRGNLLSKEEMDYLNFDLAGFFSDDLLVTIGEWLPNEEYPLKDPQRWGSLIKFKISLWNARGEEVATYYREPPQKGWCFNEISILPDNRIQISYELVPQYNRNNPQLEYILIKWENNTLSEIEE